MTRAQLEDRLMELAQDVKQYLDEEQPDDRQRIIADVILVIGTRSFDEDGRCVGTVYQMCNESSIPGYVAAGLLREALDDMAAEPRP